MLVVDENNNNTFKGIFKILLIGCFGFLVYKLGCKASSGNTSIEESLGTEIVDTVDIEEPEHGISGVPITLPPTDDTNPPVSTDVSSESNGTLKPEDIYERLKKSVFVLYINGTDGSQSQGSGFAVTSEGHLVTNYHVIENFSNGYVKDIYETEYKIEDIIDSDQNYDYALIKINSKTVPVKIANNNPKVGSQCYALGAPQGLDYTFTNGLISSYKFGTDLIQTNVLADHGSSGCPLANERGEVVGIMTAKISNGITFAVNLIQKNKTGSF